MTLADPIGDMLTRIRNGQMRSLNKIEIPFSSFRSKILEDLKNEGYIINYNIKCNITRNTYNKWIHNNMFKFKFFLINIFSFDYINYKI